jgi:hypothetical protein
MSLATLAVSGYAYSKSKSMNEDALLGSPAGWLARGFLALGWRLDSVGHGTMTVSFADLASPAASRLVPLASGDLPAAVAAQRVSSEFEVSALPTATRLPVTASEELNIWYLGLEKSADRLDATLVRVDSDRGRAWAESVLRMGAPRPCPLGQGFASGLGIVIDTGEYLLRGLWSDGRPLNGQSESPAARLDALGQRTHALVDALRADR